MNLTSRIYAYSLVTLGTLGISLCSYELTSLALSKNFPQKNERRNHQNSKIKYFDVDEWMFDMMQKNQIDLPVNPEWYFQHARDKTSALSI